MKEHIKKPSGLAIFAGAFAVSLAISLSAFAQADNPKIIHDAEYYILAAQNGEQWAAEDKAIDQRLAALRKANGGRPPNIVIILLDDVGYGEIGTPDLTPSRGYSTPNIDAFARQGLTLGRMYSEPSCTPTRVAMMTGSAARQDGNDRGQGHDRRRRAGG